MLPSPDQNLKIGSVGRDFFFFFLRTARELSFPIFFLKFLNGENSGGMQSKHIYKSCKCFFKPLNTNFSKFFAQIWHKKKKKKTPTLFFRILRSVGRGQHNIFFFLALLQRRGGVECPFVVCPCFNHVTTPWPLTPGSKHCEVRLTFPSMIADKLR